MKPIKIIRNITFILAAVYCLGAGLNIYDHQKDVQARTVIQTIELGYVNTDHAISTGTKQFLDKNLARTFHRNDTISYAQYWGNPMLGEHFIQIEKKFVVKRNLSEADKESALFLIYKDVSEAFEKFQLRVPYYLVDNPFGYICAIGDVQGNLVSYYCARQNISSDKYLNQLKIKEIDDSFFTILKMDKASIYDWNLGIQEPKLAAFYAAFEGKVLVDYVEEIEFRQEFRVK